MLWNFDWRWNMDSFGGTIVRRKSLFHKFSVAKILFVGSERFAVFVVLPATFVVAHCYAVVVRGTYRCTIVLRPRPPRDLHKSWIYGSGRRRWRQHNGRQWPVCRTGSYGRASQRVPFRRVFIGGHSIYHLWCQENCSESAGYEWFNCLGKHLWFVWFALGLLTIWFRWWMEDMVTPKYIQKSSPEVRANLPTLISVYSSLLRLWNCWM